MADDVDALAEHLFAAQFLNRSVAEHAWSGITDAEWNKWRLLAEAALEWMALRPA